MLTTGCRANAAATTGRRIGWGDFVRISAHGHDGEPKYTPGGYLPLDSLLMESATTYLSDQDKKSMANRLSRVEGQVRALRSSLEEGACADDLILQAAAARGALRQVIVRLLETHLVACATTCMEGDQDEILDRVSKAVAAAMKH
ncbi:MAG: metal-sensitive transcriptional regulator [Planctomycetota bacterium]|nr:MAG: metal-sensitive transcriptional regulator [Planctomycetota bacterium]